jgi:hypothetical protein
MFPSELWINRVKMTVPFMKVTVEKWEFAADFIIKEINLIEN